jgi:pimeloyl-ACP methyl ester carboxylesterase
MYFAEPYAPLVAPHLARVRAKAILAARYIEIADAGHVPQYEQPDAFRAALVDWLAAT